MRRQSWCTTQKRCWDLQAVVTDLCISTRGSAGVYWGLFQGEKTFIPLVVLNLVFICCVGKHTDAFSTGSLARTTSRLAGHLDIWNPTILSFASAQPQLASVPEHWELHTHPWWVTEFLQLNLHPSEVGSHQHSDGCVEFQSQKKKKKRLNLRTHVSLLS